MLQIVYTSTANQEFSPADLERLLAGARRRNKLRVRQWLANRLRKSALCRSHT